MTDKDVYYVEIPNPLDFRRSLLEASRDFIRGLQKHEDLKKIRAKKIKEISNLKSNVREINMLINQARSTLPTVSVKEASKEKHKKKKEVHIKKESKKSEDKPREVAELEKQLKDIEGKLSSL